MSGFGQLPNVSAWREAKATPTRNGALLAVVQVGFA